uniref:Endonuclease/exonuclease/phosphatase domain-containing protein n=1 Tax=Photinus pyralis TaxID=7054 RepID=A0A1Y1L8T3_PHOPY
MIKKYKKNILIMGDLNIDYLQNSPSKLALEDIFDCFHLKTLIHEPTRSFTNINGHSSNTCLDYVIVDQSLEQRLLRCDNHECNIADHTAQILEIKTTNYKQTNLTNRRTYRAITQTSLASLRSDLKFLPSINPTNIDTSVHQFTVALRYYIEIWFPRKILRPRSNKGWVTSEIRNESEALRKQFSLIKSVTSLELRREYN